MRTIRLSEADCLSEAEADALAGTFPGEGSYDRLIGGEDAEVVKPDGGTLLVYRRGAIPAGACRAAFPALRRVPFDGGNRGLASGDVPSSRLDAPVGARSRSLVYRLKRDGTVSRTSNAIGGRNLKTSGVIGFFDRTGRFPYCRQTAFNTDHPELFAAALPLIRSADRAFAAAVPDRYAAQAAVTARTPPEYVIPGTAFTTVTVNRNWQTAVHKDAGDFRAGFGVMCVLRAGRYDGCYLCFPRFRTAVDLRTGDVLLADVHEWHGNTPFVGVPGAFERISCVLYYRERMHQCGSPEEELELAKRRTSRVGIKG